MTSPETQRMRGDAVLQDTNYKIFVDILMKKENYIINEAKKDNITYTYEDIIRYIYHPVVTTDPQTAIYIDISYYLSIIKPKELYVVMPQTMARIAFDIISNHNKQFETQVEKHYRL